MAFIDHMVLGSVSTNCYFLKSADSKEAVIIDPADSPEQIKEYLEKEQLQPKAILLTHGHYDHIMAAKELREQYQIPVYACEKEKPLLNDAALNLSKFGSKGAYTLDADVYCKDGDEFQLAGCGIRVLETPGHTPGSCCYKLTEQSVCFVGDTLFSESIGRTDFPGGSYAQICQSIREKLFTLPDFTVCYPGHGETTMIGYEKGHNPYVR